MGLQNVRKQAEGEQDREVVGLPRAGGSGRHADLETSVPA